MAESLRHYMYNTINTYAIEKVVYYMSDIVYVAYNIFICIVQNI